MPNTCGLTNPLFNYSGDLQSHGYCMILWYWGILLASMWVGLWWFILYCAGLFVYKMVLGALLQPTKWYGHKPRPYKMAFLVNYLGSFLSTMILAFSSKNGQAFAFMLLKKLQSHFVELPPCPEISSKGNFSIAIL